MKLLAIDTSTNIASFALAINNQLIVKELNNIKQHAEHLLPTINELLQEACLTIAECDGIVFGRGPGSFTGLRIACSVAQALAYAHDLPLYPVSTLQAMAYHAFALNPLKEDDEVILSVIDARMQQVYWAYYDKNFTTVKENVSNPEDIINFKKPVIISGFNIEGYYNNLPSYLHKAEKIIIHPNARDMIKLVQEGFVKKINAEDALPVYIRDAVTG